MYSIIYVYTVCINVYNTYTVEPRYNTVVGVLSGDHVIDEARYCEQGCSVWGGCNTPPLFTELVGKTRSRSEIAEAVGKTDRLN